MSKTAFDINIFVQNYRHPPRNNNGRGDVPDGRENGVSWERDWWKRGGSSGRFSRGGWGRGSARRGSEDEDAEAVAGSGVAEDEAAAAEGQS